MLTILAALLVLLPLALLRRGLRLGLLMGRQRRQWRTVPLPQKNMTRATGGAFVLVACAVLAANGFPVVGWKLTAGLGAFALLYLVVGIHGAQGSRFDVMSCFWWGVLALGGGALLVFIEGIRL